MTAYCLSIHAGYRCASSGMCCTAGWPIPVEERLLPLLRADGLLPNTGAPRLRTLPLPVNGSRLATAVSGDGACAFFEPARGRLCAIHRISGAHRLPAACRSFPRIALRDGRGLFITLSHYCPTAARMLLSPGPLRIVQAPASLSLDGDVEGLDATTVLPPLLRPGMLLDLEGYTAWEEQAMAVLDDRRLPAPAALSVIRAATEAATRWQPGGPRLADSIVRGFDAARDRSSSEPLSGRLEHATKAFLAAHLFASWAAYQNGGLMAICDEVERAHGLIGVQTTDDGFIEAVRKADLCLRHQVNSQPPTPNSQGERFAPSVGKP
jgi:Fe-S-cluster containining protein